MKTFKQDQFRKILLDTQAIIQDYIFIYKSGMIGDEYVDKEALASCGAIDMNACLRGMAQHAVDNGMVFPEYTGKTIGIIGPAYGAISYPPVIAEWLGIKFPKVKFITARTQLDENGDHYIPDKLLSHYQAADAWILTEDIINQGTTVKEVGELIRNVLKSELISALALVSRGGKTAEELNCGSLHAFLNEKMSVFDPREDTSLFESGLQINTTLGKGAKWVAEFGTPPYVANTNFEDFSLFK